MENCRNCGALHTGDCEYCGTKYTVDAPIFYDPRYIDPSQLGQPQAMLQLQYLNSNANTSFWSNLIDGGVRVADVICRPPKFFSNR